MPKEFKRIDRIAELIQRELAQLIQHDIKDPRITHMIGVSAVKVTNDLSYAKVYITILNADEKAIKDTIDVLQHAAGFLRSTLARNLKLRTMPELQFKYDTLLAEGNRLMDLINEAVESDAKKK